MDLKDLGDFETNKKRWEAEWVKQLNNLRNGIVPDLGNNWGILDDKNAKENVSGDVLGNYKKIHEEYITPFIKKDSIILDIGVGGGKWIPYFSNAKKVICVDLIDSSFEFIKSNYNHLSNLHFYKTEGFELSGIASNSINFIFCMDALVRYSFSDMEMYFREFNRTLVPSGNVCIHLPYIDSKLASKFKFSEYRMDELIKLKNIFTKNNFEIDTNIINHGVLIH